MRASSSLLALLTLTGHLYAATIKVTSTADSGAGTLREALASATDGDTIDATGVSGTIFLTNGMLVVTNSITILGPGADVLAVDGNWQWCGQHYPCSISDSRVFLIGPVNVTISGLTITNGLAYADYGGGIYSAGATLTLSNCTITGNSALAGGGIFNDGSSFGSATLTVVNSTFSHNSAHRGGGIYNDHSTLTVSNCTFSANSAPNGAGIYNDGLFSGSATLSVSASTFSGNSALGGGGIFNNGSSSGRATLSVSASTFSSNSVGLGGGILNWGQDSGTGTVTVVTSTFSGNSASLDGGAIYNDGKFSGNATLSVSASTVSGNSAGDRGGGIANDTATLTVLACTISGNSAGFGGDAIFNSNGEAGGSATLEIGNTILEAGPTGVNIRNEFGTVTSRGYNLSSDDGGGFLTNTTDQINTDPMLGPLQDNGGPTFTHALLCGSPAIDAGKRDAIPALALDTDQRGFPRPVGSPAVAGGDGSDIGAFEVQPAPGCTISCPSDITSSTAPGICGATVTFNVCSSESCPSIVATPPSGSFFTTGTTPVTVSTNGVILCTFNVNVNDTQPPTITCPANIIINVGHEATSAVVTFSDPVANDNCGMAWTACAPLSGSTFGLGTNTVTCTALDTSGNTNSCTFKVIVLQTPPGPCPDLTGTWSNLVQTCKTKKDGVHCKVKGKLIVQNIGTTNAPTSFVRYYLSSDATFDAGDTLLKQVATGTVKLSKPKKRTLSAKLPIGVIGSGQFILAVIDAGHTVAGCDEDNNNVIAFGPLP